MFYPSVFDPKLIIYQIIFLQSSFYIILSIPFIISYVILTDTTVSFYTLFTANNLTYTHITSYIISVPLLSITIVVIVGRAKKVLDYVSTVYIIHYIICSLTEYSILHSIQYYILNTTTCVCTILLAEYLCVQKEMKTINLSSSASSSSIRNQNNNNTNGNNNNSNNTTSSSYTAGQQLGSNGYTDEIEMQSTQTNKRNGVFGTAKPLILGV